MEILFYNTKFASDYLAKSVFVHQTCVFVH